jgi:hypothetical protein
VDTAAFEPTATTEQPAAAETTEATAEQTQAEPQTISGPSDQAQAESDTTPIDQPATESLAPVSEPTAEQTAPVGASETAQPSAKPKRQRKAPAQPKEKKVSALDAAARVLAEEGRPMTCQELIAAMAAKGYWTSPGGQTPDATLSSAIARAITLQGSTLGSRRRHVASSRVRPQRNVVRHVVAHEAPRGPLHVGRHPRPHLPPDATWAKRGRTRGLFSGAGRGCPFHGTFAEKGAAPYRSPP